MNSIRSFSSLALVLLCASPLAAAATTPSGAEAVDHAWAKAITAGNVDALVALYAKNGIAWLPNMPEAKGRDAIRKCYSELLAANNVVKAAFSNTQYRTVGDISTGWGEFTLTLAPKAGGDPVTVSGRFSAVAIKEDGKWVYLMDHASAHPPPSPKT